MKSNKDEFKETEIGLIPEEWGAAELGDLISLVIDHRGLTPKKLGGDWSSAGVQAISAMNIKDGRLVSLDGSKFVDETLYKKWMPVELEAEDVLLTSEAPLGETYLIKENEKFCLSQRLFALRTKKDILDSGYLFYFLHSPKGQQELHGRATGSVVTGIRQSELMKIEVDLPPVNEQSRIASILSSLDDKIELNRQINANLEKMASALFKRWFVDFEFPDENGRPYKSSGGKMVETEMGEVPEGWKVSYIGNEVKVVGGGTPSTVKSEYWDGDIYWATPKDLSSLVDPIILKAESRITESGLGQIGSGLLPTGTVLLSSRAPIGYLAIAEIPLAINQGFIAMICEGTISKHYMRLWVKRNMEIIKGYANGSTFLEVNKANFRSLPVIVPERQTLKRFDLQMESIHQRMLNSLKESQALIIIRDSLLPRLMSGKIRA